jgi:hypothetical protein
MHSIPNQGEDSTSQADESDEAFTFYGYDSDPDLWCALSQQAARETAESHRSRAIDKHQTKNTTFA